MTWTKTTDRDLPKLGVPVLGAWRAIGWERWGYCVVWRTDAGWESDSDDSDPPDLWAEITEPGTGLAVGSCVAL